MAGADGTGRSRWLRIKNRSVTLKGSRAAPHGQDTYKLHIDGANYRQDVASCPVLAGSGSTPQLFLSTVGLGVGETVYSKENDRFLRLCDASTVSECGAYSWYRFRRKGPTSPSRRAHFKLGL